MALGAQVQTVPSEAPEFTEHGARMLRQEVGDPGEDTSRALDALRALVKDGQRRAPNRWPDAWLRWKASGWERRPP
jgi:hypothetical protein